MTFGIVTDSPEATRTVGEALAAGLRGGELVTLSGPLGAGKTVLAKGLAAGLGVSRDEPVISPTFVIVREYSGRLTLFHMDAYRLAAAEELELLGFSEMRQQPGAVVVMEWPERIWDTPPADAIAVTVEYGANPDERIIRVQLPALAAAENWSKLAALRNFEI